jgi:hypothetical protein
MFEDFKNKIRQHESKKIEPSPLSPEVLANLRREGLYPETVTMKQLFPETLDGDGNDLSLMSGAEWEIMITYAKARKYLLEKYPQSQQEAKLLGQEWAEEPNDPLQINIAKAREDPLSKVFIEALNQMKAIYDKVDVLQNKASEYEKYCLRLYWHISYNWNHAPNIEVFQDGFRDRDCDLFEIVEAYFNICRKFHVPTFEEPYYFLSEKRRREIKLEGDMLRRSTDYSDNEIRVSILEAF